MTAAATPSAQTALVARRAPAHRWLHACQIVCGVAVLSAQGLATVRRHRQESVGASCSDTLVGELLTPEVGELVVLDRSRLEIRDVADQVPTLLGAYLELLRLANAPLLG